MAPIKRRRQENDAEIVEVESASSSLQHAAQHKRARVSVNHTSPKGRVSREQSTSCSSSESDDEEIAAPDEDTPPLQSSTQYELLRDNNFEHLKNPELDDRILTQKLMTRRRERIGDNHAADNAIIEEITCINFMCHSRLHVKLGPLINFVVGMNGSGKSAVLTAITLCLGGKASATNRGASLKSLIKGGTDQAILTVKLKNGGVDAYQPDLFGDAIIVERYFSRFGSSGYRLRSSTGRTVSTKKSDVDDIIEYYQLQVDNPMNVLTQDAAKSFIRDSTPRQKYKFFVDGVQLQQLDNDYKLISDICDQIEVKFDEAKGHLKDLEKVRDEAQAKADIVEQHVDMRRAARALGNQLAWAQVEESEAKFREREAAVHEAQQKIDDMERDAEAKGLAYELTNGLVTRSEALVGSLKGTEVGPIQEEETIAKAAYDEAVSAVTDAHHQERDIKSDLTAAQTKVEKLRMDIAEEEKRIEDANGGAQGRKQAEISEAHQAVSSAKQALRVHESEYPRLETVHREAEESLKKADDTLNRSYKEVEDCRHVLNELNTNRVNLMAGFPSRMSQLIQRVRNDKGFIDNPIGPIGLHIKLLNSKWSRMLETVIGDTLNAFIVTCKADQTRLINIIKQLNVDRCPVLIGNSHAFSTVGHEPDPHYETIMRVLEIDNELVKRQLVINCRIEQSLLIPSRADGQRVMFDGPRPRYVSQCYTPHDTERDGGHRLTYTGDNNAEISSLRFKGFQKPRMQTNLESRLTVQKEHLTELETEKIGHENRKRILQQALKKCQLALEHHSRTHKTLKIAVQKADDLVDKLQAEFDQVNIEDGRLDAFKSDLEEAHRDLNMYEATYGQHRLQKTKLNEQSMTKKQELKGVKLRLDEIHKKIEKAEKQLKNHTQARQIAVQDKNLAVVAIDSAKNEKLKVEEKLKVRANHLEQFTSQALAVCERVPVDAHETATTLDKKLKSLVAKLNEYARRVGGNDQEIYDRLANAKTRYEDLKHHLQLTKELLQLLKQSFLKRIHMFRRFQKFVSSRSRINFNYLLSERAFRGKLQIDHKAKKLDVQVQPDKTVKSDKGRQTKTLSGGEKSFASICLLLALWEAMGAPLRCLDEYDVFMDDVNRDVSSKMIIGAARQSVGRQFILITPKALGAGVEIGPDVQVHKLLDPREQGQRRVDEMLEDE